MVEMHMYSNWTLIKWERVCDKVEATGGHAGHSAQILVQYLTLLDEIHSKLFKYYTALQKVSYTWLTLNVKYVKIFGGFFKKTDDLYIFFYNQYIVCIQGHLLDRCVWESLY